jgi:predicted PurR-regulated permease PerM
MTQEDESRFCGRVFWLTAAGLLALALLSILRPFFESILWAGLLAFLLAPVTRQLTRAFRGRRSLSALLVTPAGALFVLIPAVVTVASSGAFFAGVLGVVVEVTLTLFLLFFFVRDGEQAVARGLTLIPLSAERKDHLVGHLSAVTPAVALGTLLTAAWAPPSSSPSGGWWWSRWWTTSSSRWSSRAAHRSRRCPCSSA